MKCSIVLIAYHGDRWLPACLSSLADASADRQHLLLVDNSGNSNIEAHDVSAFDTQLIRTPEPMGFAQANNYALVHADKIEGGVLFLNQDTLSEPGWVDECLGVFEQFDNIGAVSPVIRTYDGDGWDPSFLSCLGQVNEDQLQVGLREPVFVRNAPAPALLVRTDVLLKTGPFDPVFGSYYEDFDLCRRIRALGRKIAFWPPAVLRHYSGGSTDSRSRELTRMRQIIRNRTLYRLREEGQHRLSGVFQAFFLEFPHRLARGFAGTKSSQPPSVTLKAYMDLLRLLPRIVSASHDRALWNRYLAEIGWNSLTLASD